MQDDEVEIVAGGVQVVDVEIKVGRRVVHGVVGGIQVVDSCRWSTGC